MEDIVFIIGTNAEMIKMAPVMRKLEEFNVKYSFVSTGQHDLGEMCEEFKVKKPDKVLTSAYKERFNSDKVKAVKWVWETSRKIKRMLGKEKRKFVLVHGDTMSTLAAAVGAGSVKFLRRHVLFHVEAGLRSGDLKEPFPEEIIRRIVDMMSDYNFCCVEKCKIKNSIFTGNTINEAVEMMVEGERYVDDEEKVERFALMTIHRHENITDKKRMMKIVSALEGVKVKVRWMMHSNTKRKIDEYGLWGKIKENENLYVESPKKYKEFINLMASDRCALVITDGGSMQEECLALKKYCIVMRMTTERKEACRAGTQFLTKLSVGRTKEKISEFLDKYNDSVYEGRNPYHKMNASEVIALTLKNLVL